MYVAVKGGERAIDNAHAWLDEERRGDTAVAELSVAQIREQLKLAVNRVMAEGSLYDPDLAALAIKQSRGDRLVEHKDMFTGLFWTGGKALELGLVDAIGDLRSVVKAKYGVKTKVKLIEPKRGLFGNRVASGVSTMSGFDGEGLAAGAASGFLTAAEEKLLWNRLGL